MKIKICVMSEKVITNKFLIKYTGTTLYLHFNHIDLWTNADVYYLLKKQFCSSICFSVNLVKIN